MIYDIEKEHKKLFLEFQCYRRTLDSSYIITLSKSLCENIKSVLPFKSSKKWEVLACSGLMRVISTKEEEFNKFINSLEYHYSSESIKPIGEIFIEKFKNLRNFFVGNENFLEKIFTKLSNEELDNLKELSRSMAKIHINNVIKSIQEESIKTDIAKDSFASKIRAEEITR